MMLGHWKQLLFAFLHLLLLQLKQGTMSIIKVCSGVYNTRLHPLSTFCFIALSIQECSGRGCSSACCFFLSIPFQSFNVKLTTNRFSSPNRMVVNPCSSLITSKGLLAPDFILLCFEVFCVYVTSVSIVLFPSSLSCTSLVSTKVVVVGFNFSIPPYSISSSLLRFYSFLLSNPPSLS